MSELVFYTNPRSRGQIVRWMLEELEIPYVTMVLEYGAPMKDPEYLEINPMGKVPAIQCGDAIVTETPAICAWLAEKFPEKKLGPVPGSAEAASYYRWLFFAAGPLEMATTAKTFNWNADEDSQRALGFGCYEDTVDALEMALTHGPYICGRRFTAADVYVGSCINWGLLFGSLDKRPPFEPYVQRLNARPAAMRAFELDEALRRVRA